MAVEFFSHMAGWHSGILLTDPSQAKTSEWAQASSWGLVDTAWLGIGEITGGQNALRAAIDLNAAVPGDSWWCIGASHSDVANARRIRFPGARAVAFYFVAANSNASVTIDVEGRNQWGRHVVERRTLSQRTHSTYTAGQGGTAVAAGFYNPNNTALGGPTFATYTGLPLARDCQTLGAFTEARRITLVSKSNISSGDRLVPNGKTLRFGIQGVLNSVADILGGVVTTTPMNPTNPTGEGWTFSAAVPPIVNFAGGNPAPLQMEYATIDKERGLLQLDNTVGGRNGHVWRSNDAFIQFVEWRGEMLMWPNHYWDLFLNVRDMRSTVDAVDER